MTPVSRAILLLVMLTLSWDVFGVLELGPITLRICQLFIVCLGLYLGFEVLVGRRRKVTVSAPIAYPYIALCLVGFCSVLVSLDVTKSLLYSVWLVFNGFFFVFVTANVVGTDVRSANWALTAYMWSFIIMSLLGIFQATSAIGGVALPFVKAWIVPGVLARAPGFNYEPSYYATYLTLGFVLTGRLATISSPFYSRKLMALTHMLTFIALVLSTARAGIVVIALFYGYTLLEQAYMMYRGQFNINFSRQMVVLIGAFSTIIVALSATGLINQFVRFFTDLNATFINSSFAPRLKTIYEAIDVFLERPILGVGIGGLGAYQTDIERTLFDRALPLPLIGNWQRTGSNITTEMLAEIGLLGLVCFTVVMVQFCLLGFRRMRTSSSPTYSVPIQGIILALVFELVILQFNQNILRTYLWFHIGLGLGIFKAYTTLGEERELSV